MSDDTPKPSAPEFFGQEMAENYDARNSKLAPISDNMHFLVRLILEDLPANARILCVGAGTGAEILSLAEANAGWTFVAVEPSEAMLGVCHRRLEEAGILERCELIHGYVGDAPEGAGFDAVLSILVAHFIPREDRTGFYRGIHDRLKPGGYFVSCEISFDLDSAEFPAMVANWARVQARMGATPELLQTLPETMRNMLSILSPADTEDMLKATGFALPVAFFQAFMVRGWFAVK